MLPCECIGTWAAIRFASIDATHNRRRACHAATCLTDCFRLARPEPSSRACNVFAPCESHFWLAWTATDPPAARCGSTRHEWQRTQEVLHVENWRSRAVGYGPASHRNDHDRSGSGCSGGALESRRQLDPRPQERRRTAWGRPPRRRPSRRRGKTLARRWRRTALARRRGRQTLARRRRAPPWMAPWWRFRNLYRARLLRRRGLLVAVAPSPADRQSVLVAPLSLSMPLSTRCPPLPWRAVLRLSVRDASDRADLTID
jgi:hypothetical protein